MRMKLRAVQREGERNSPVIAWFCGLFLLTAFSSCTTALTRPLWNDEVITAVVVRLKHFSSIWNALQKGADAQPPAYYWLSTWLPSGSENPEFWLRVPAVIGFLVLIVSVFLFMYSAKGPAAAIVSAAVLISSEGLYYASEARPYGALLGSLGLAAFLWQRRKQGDQSSATLIGLIFVLTIACALHYFGIFAAMIFGLAEISLGTTSRRPDWKLLLSLPVTLVPLLCAERLIRGEHNQYGTAFWARPSWRTFFGAYKFSFSMPTISFGTLFRFHGADINIGHLLPVIFLVTVLAVLFFRARRGGGAPGPNLRVVPPELVLGISFLFLPVVVGSASLVTGAFTERYAIGSLIGTAVVFGWVMTAVGDRFAYSVAFILALFLLLHQTLPDIRRMAELMHGRTATAIARADLSPIFRRARSDEPLVIPDGHLFLEATQYADVAVRHNLVYLQDHALALQFAGADTSEATNDGIRPYIDIRLKPPIAFLAKYNRFLMATRVSAGWLGTYLRCAGAQIQQLETNSEGIKIFAVSLPAHAVANERGEMTSEPTHKQSLCSEGRVDTDLVTHVESNSRE